MFLKLLETLMSDVASSNPPNLMGSSLAPAASQLSRIRREMHHVSVRYRSKQFWLLTGVFGSVALCFAAMFRGVALGG
ncbi:MAG: hypothetical protein AAGJ83_04260, partial [Planctomycetota bacterium]